MLTLEEAKVLALRELPKLAGERELAFHDNAICKRYGWVLFYNSRRYIETGDFLDSLFGNGPVVVMHDGGVHLLGTDRNPDAMIADFERERGL